MTNEGRTDNKLDFVVYGVARSGTTALAEAINLEPSTYCAGEFFADVRKVDVAALTMPTSFLDEGSLFAQPRKALHSRRILNQKLAAGPVLHFGNKQPEYIMIIDRLKQDLATLRHLCIYRSPRAIERSFSSRAKDPKDLLWSPGRIGLFGIYDWLILIATLAQTPKNITIVDYDSLFYKNSELLPGVFERIGVDNYAPDAIDEFRSSIFRASTKKNHAEDGDPVSAMLKMCGAEDINAQVSASPLAGAEVFSTSFRTFAESKGDSIANFIVDRLLAEKNDAAASYAYVYACSRLTSYDNPASPVYLMLRAHMTNLVERLHTEVPAARGVHCRRFLSILRDPLRGDPDAAGRYERLLERYPPHKSAIAARRAESVLRRANATALMHFARARQLAADGLLPAALAALDEALVAAPNLERAMKLRERITHRLRRKTHSAS